MPTFDRLIPVLTYRDIPAAHDFLVQAPGSTASRSISRTVSASTVHATSKGTAGGS